MHILSIHAFIAWSHARTIPWSNPPAGHNSSLDSNVCAWCWAGSLWTTPKSTDRFDHHINNLISDVLRITHHPSLLLCGLVETQKHTYSRHAQNTFRPIRIQPILTETHTRTQTLRLQPLFTGTCMLCFGQPTPRRSARARNKTIRLRVCPAYMHFMFLSCAKLSREWVQVYESVCVHVCTANVLCAHTWFTKTQFCDTLRM